MVRSKMDGREGGLAADERMNALSSVLSVPPSLQFTAGGAGRGRSSLSRQMTTLAASRATRGGSVFFLISLERHRRHRPPSLSLSVIAKAALCLADRNSTRWSSQGRLFYVLFFPPRPPSRSPLTPPRNGHRLPPLVLPPDPSPSPSVVGARAPQVGTQIFPPKAA